MFYRFDINFLRADTLPGFLLISKSNLDSGEPEYLPVRIERTNHRFTYVSILCGSSHISLSLRYRMYAKFITFCDPIMLVSINHADLIIMINRLKFVSFTKLSTHFCNVINDFSMISCSLVRDHHFHLSAKISSENILYF